jgi:hypothetical protein
VAVVFVLGCQVVISAPPAAAADCGQAPNPQRPGAGLVGTIDTPGLTSNPSPYDTYGYAGMVWYTFQTSCQGPLATLTDPTSGLATDTGNFLFNGAKLVVGSTNGLHHAVTDSTLLGPIYRAVQSGANKVYTNIYTQLLALCALLLSLIVLRSVWRGDLATVSKRTLYGLAALWLAASSVVLLRYLEPFDHAVVGFTTDIQNGFTADSDRNPAADLLPERLHDQIVYRNWLRGEFGAPTAPQAQQYGRPLLDAQAFTVAQLASGADADVHVIDAKKHAYIDISGKLGPATDTFTGARGGRIGTGLLALLEAITYSLFPFLAALMVLLAQVVLRLLILTAPLLGLMALLNPGLLRGLAKAAGIVGFNLLVVSTLAGIHSLLLQAVFTANMPVTAQLGIAGIITALAWGIARPLRRLSQAFKAPTQVLGEFIPTTRGRIFTKRNTTARITPEQNFYGQLSLNLPDYLATSEENKGPVRVEAYGVAPQVPGTAHPRHFNEHSEDLVFPSSLEGQSDKEHRALFQRGETIGEISPSDHNSVPPETNMANGPQLGSRHEWPDDSLTPEQGTARIEAGLARARKVIGRERWSNSTMAGKVYFDRLSDDLKGRYPDGVRFSYEGFPIFDPHATKTVTLKEGFGPSRTSDFKKANQISGLSKTPDGYTWHHKEDGHTLLLVDKDLHRDVRHWGGVSISKALGKWNEGEPK